MPFRRPAALVRAALRRSAHPALVVAFCLAVLPEALAGFVAPVAICPAMLVVLGFEPVREAAVAPAADTAPVVFGAVGRRW